ncbi:ABC transporter ATP-binding protein [Jeotgalicoccus coquinae]|uniref:Iron complex transport system ATP-binding protein n=1 Tax=Jeotgalicoccus coquinae TaxID=709509 RepID=A0A6V7R0M0_9STAP|nr:ABC transporter ATP-binding protein [Jeotgalicoccus coquinae]MBB6423794.1 iron complex transport system ATP-binding protein [Jeotgalicoccus coquinae]GGE22618.1 ABC transporter ATP-binding protein [Jeotgalicoccus coquinae]CAD2070628.1 putative ABC transporter ATP-binding protein YlmA [Jeotgalicoccus coquinae]
MEKILSLNNIIWRRNGDTILNDISFEVNKGEQWAVLGLNGAGKTSLLDIIMGYNYPTAGSASVIGTEFGRASLPDMRKRIGYVSSSLDKFHETLNRETGLNIVLSGKFSSFGIYQDIDEASKERAEKVLQDLNLSHLMDRTYNTFSQGERRRVLIGRALMGNPELLILDEPCSGLDIRAREDVLKIVNKIPEEERHLFYVTHHIEELTGSITHVLLIKDGGIVAAGPKEEVLTGTLLSETYKTPVKVYFENERPWLVIDDVEGNND